MNISNNKFTGNILDIEFYGRDTSIVAVELIGKLLVRRFSGKRSSKALGGIITETEAYYGIDDPASHAYRGVTGRSKIMFGRPGIAYVYFCYGMHHMLNAVTEKEGIPGAVLIRAVRPVSGIEIMISNRHASSTGNLTHGPGKLTEAFGITLDDNGRDLTQESSCLNICDHGIDSGRVRIKRSNRIGLSRGKDMQLRFTMTDE